MQGLPANVTIPPQIAPGNYLLRSELIALQLAVSVGGAEFYPGCIQLSIGGSGTGAPTSSEEYTFPGGYSDNDPGIYDPNVSLFLCFRERDLKASDKVYNPPLTYTFPGPPVAAFVGSGAVVGGTQPSQGGSAGGSSATPTAAGTSTPTPSASSGECHPFNRFHFCPSHPFSKYLLTTCDRAR